MVALMQIHIHTHIGVDAEWKVKFSIERIESKNGFRTQPFCYINKTSYH